MSTTRDGPIFVEDTDEKADWIKTLTWDLPDDFDDLMRQLAPNASLTAQKRALSDLIDLPAWGPAPAPVKRAAADFLAGDTPVV